MKTRLSNIALVTLIAVMTMMSVGASADNIKITLKNGVVYSYDTSELDEVKYVGGDYGSATGIGVKIYLKGADSSIDFLYSEMTSFEVQSIAAPEITPGSRYITGSTTVTITCDTPGAIIYYTTDGTDPTTSSRSGSSPVTFTVNETKTVRAIAVLENMTSEVVEAVYTFTDDGNLNRNALSPNWEKNTGNMTGTPKSYNFWKLEFPHISEKSNTSWLQKYIAEDVNEYGVNYNVEWDNDLVANRWTCYRMDRKNTEENVDRKDDFKADDELLEASRSTLDDYSGSGYSRGHLCPAADRKCSTAMVKQTCLLSNMQPQWQYHNGGQWASLEGDVRKWAARCDTLYVVKAATISDKVTLNGRQEDGVFSERCIGTGSDARPEGLLVPKYFYMALLAYDKSSDTYQAMGVWTYHCSSSSNKQSAEYITIDELEQRTGIDFFCNLPDDIEADVEASMTRSYWIYNNGGTDKVEPR